MSAMATVSPNSICAAVEVTGARSKGHSSRSRGRCTARSHTADRRHPCTDVTATSRAPLACTGERRLHLRATSCSAIFHTGQYHPCFVLWLPDRGQMRCHLAHNKHKAALCCGAKDLDSRVLQLTPTLLMLRV